MQINAIGQFREAIQAAGVNQPDDIEAEGKLHSIAKHLLLQET